MDITARIAAALPDVKILQWSRTWRRCPAPSTTSAAWYWPDAEHAIAESDVIALLVDHSCFRTIKKTQLAARAVYNTRGIWA